MVRPNNPDGAILPHAEFWRRARELHARGLTVKDAAPLMGYSGPRAERSFSRRLNRQPHMNPWRTKTRAEIWQEEHGEDMLDAIQRMAKRHHKTFVAHALGFMHHAGLGYYLKQRGVSVQFRRLQS